MHLVPSTSRCSRTSRCDRVARRPRGSLAVRLSSNALHLSSRISTLFPLFLYSTKIRAPFNRVWSTSTLRRHAYSQPKWCLLNTQNILGDTFQTANDHSGSFPPSSRAAPMGRGRYSPVNMTPFASRLARHVRHHVVARYLPVHIRARSSA
ncbi:hypothetical protein OG21DRAFT_961240 [Imleria badia]|nr:hypothetical protein OG21DRAFT_961240 [Imleria badia]